MAEDIYIQTTNADGDEISGAYRSSGGIIMVTMSQNAGQTRLIQQPHK